MQQRHAVSGIRKKVTSHDETASVIFLGQVKGQVTSGYQRSCFAFFNIFSTNRHITRESKELQRRRKAHSIAYLTLFRYGALRFDLRLVLPPESKTSKNSRFAKNVLRK